MAAALFRPFPAERRNMGEPNVALGVYMNHPDRIRSVLEYYLGEKLPEDWMYEERRGLYPVKDSGGKLTYRQRDLIGKAYVWGTSFLLGLENQQNVNLTFPWRLLELDCLAYGQEIEAAGESNRNAGKQYGKGDDFLYRYGEEDRIEPILNLTLYWGKRKWERPFSLREMMKDISALPVKLRQLAGDYQAHVIPMREIPESALQEMDSDLKYVLGIMKRTRSSKKYEAYIRENREYFSRIPRSALDVIDVCTNIKDIRGYLQFVKNEESREEEADMCYALDQIQRNAEKKGMKKGKQEGIEQGVKQGIEQGIKQGVEQGRQQMGKLIQLLLADGRQEDLTRAATDEVYQKRLFREYRV